MHVTNSSFINLQSYYAPALYITDSPLIDQLIETSTFENNLAIGSSGAIRISNAGVAHFRSNKFINNIVSDESSPLTDWRFCDAGAIYFKCGSPDDSDEACKAILEANEFTKNLARNKGGALRYVHKNFTTVYSSDFDGRRFLSDRAL